MMNSPLMLGLDLRRVTVGDDLYKIIANRELIALNQDALGVQAKRVWTSADCKGESPDKAYIEDINRVDILAKPLADGSLAISFINVSEKDWKGMLSISVEEIERAFGKKLLAYNKFQVKDLWSGESWENESGVFEVYELGACYNVTILISGLPRPTGSQ
jgi:alpha-galactosidase